MKLYTPLELNKLVTLIDNHKALETIETIVYENEEHYDKRTYHLLLIRIANKIKTLNKIKK